MYGRQRSESCSSIGQGYPTRTPGDQSAGEKVSVLQREGDPTNGQPPGLADESQIENTGLTMTTELSIDKDAYYENAAPSPAWIDLGHTDRGASVATQSSQTYHATHGVITEDHGPV